MARPMVNLGSDTIKTRSSAVVPVFMRQKRLATATGADHHQPTEQNQADVFSFMPGFSPTSMKLNI
jgi:hypothetical protein